MSRDMAFQGSAYTTLPSLNRFKSKENSHKDRQVWSLFAGRQERGDKHDPPSSSSAKRNALFANNRFSKNRDHAFPQTVYLNRFTL